MIPLMFPATAAPPSLRIVFGEGEAGAFAPGLPVLAGETVEDLFGAARPAGRVGACALFQTGGWLLGAATVPLVAGLEEDSRRLYADIFRATRRRPLARIWNYVPAINGSGPAGLENYRLFCRGRSLAFEQEFGGAFRAVLPAASAVGSQTDALTVVFAAGDIRPRHVENPRQVAAYDYPAAYGPRAPSFSRATVVPGAEGTTVFISGTAAVRGHATVAPHCTLRQLECTLDNLREISRACELGPDLDRDGSSARHFTVYLQIGRAHV